MDHQVVEDAAGSAAPAAGLVPTIAVLAVVSLLMVAVMVRFSRAAIAGRSAPAWRWGAVYLLTWIVLVGLFLRLMVVTGEEIGGRNLALLALVAGGYLGVNAALIVFARAIERANARGAARPATARRRAEAPAVRPAPPAPSPRSWLREKLVLARNVVIALAVIAIGEMIPPLRALETYLAAHRAAWLWAAGVVAAVGVVLLAGGGAHMALAAGSPSGASDEASFAELKAAWRRRAWRRSARWRRFFVMAAGGVLTAFGVCGVIFVAGPPGIKLLIALVTAYWVARTVQGWVRVG